MNFNACLILFDACLRINKKTAVIAKVSQKELFEQIPKEVFSVTIFNSPQVVAKFSRHTTEI